MHTNDKVIDLVNATIYIKPEGYIHIHYKSHLFSIEDNKKIFEIVRENSPWEICPFLISNDDFSSHDKDSNLFNSSAEVVKHCSAYAFVVTNTAQKIMANFFVKVYKPNTPSRLFANEESAIEWIASYIKIGDFVTEH